MILVQTSISCWCICNRRRIIQALESKLTIWLWNNFGIEEFLFAGSLLSLLFLCYFVYSIQTEFCWLLLESHLHTSLVRTLVQDMERSHRLSSRTALGSVVTRLHVYRPTLQLYICHWVITQRGIRHKLINKSNVTHFSFSLKKLVWNGNGLFPCPSWKSALARYLMRTHEKICWMI